MKKCNFKFLRRKSKSGSPFYVKTKLLSVMILLMHSIFFQSFAQVDVTDLYLTNAGFDINCNYLTDGTETVATANPGNTHDVNGWTIGASPAWSAAATFEFGWAGDFNGVTIPSSGSDGASGTGEGSLGLTVGWGGDLFYLQQVTLPAGIYSIEYAVTFLSVNNINANLTAWIPDEGSGIFSDLTSIETLGVWNTSTISLKLLTETTGNIQVGMRAFASGSGSNARMIFDYVKILSLPVDKAELQALVDSASTMLANPENIPSGSTAYTDLSTSISNAQAVINDGSATVEAIFAAEEEIKIAIEGVYAAILAYNLGLTDATLDNPISVTSQIINSDFQLNGGSTDGWNTEFDIYSSDNTLFDGAPSPNFVIDGDPISETIGYQTITSLPTGVYSVKAIARGRVEDGPLMFIGGVSGSYFNSENRVGKEVNRIGDTGGDLNYGFNQYETPFIVVPDDVHALSLGIFFEGDCGWSSADNFELYYYGEIDELINKLKDDLTTLKDSSYMPSDYDLTEVNTLLATVLTNENAITLTASLNDAISTLEDVIDENIDATLSDIKVDNLTIENYSPTVYTYNYNVYTSSAEAPAVPTVTVTKSSSYADTPVINEANQVPGTTTITVTAGNGDIIIYTINFSLVQLTVIENYNATFEKLENQYLELTGVGQLTLTDTLEPLNESAVNLTSTDLWIYFKNLSPSEVMNTQLYNILVNGQRAIAGTNVRLSQYLYGTMVIPHSSAYEALTVYDGTNLSGSSIGLIINQYYKSSELGNMNDNIESFKLKRGYMATFASNEDGSGISRVYIADKGDITVNTMPNGLSNTASFVIIRQWRWTTKKGWRGSSTGAEIFNAKSNYDYNNTSYSTPNVEYVPMRHNPGWNAYENFLDKYTSTQALYYNEPDNPVDDGYSTIEDAIANYPNMMASGLRLGSPACTDGGLGWLYDFIDQCDALNYRVDFVAWHFYRKGYTAASLYSTLKSVHEETGRPLWITEFNNGCNWTYDESNLPTLEENGEVIASFIEMMDTAHFIERYFVWDGCNEELRMTNSSTGELYPAGIAYRDQVSTMSFTLDYYNGDILNGIIIQENTGGFCSVDGIIDTYYSGYTGSGAANTDNAIGNGIDYSLYFTTTGSKTITVRYASPNDGPANILINGTIVASNILFPATGSYEVFIKYPITIYAEAGEANIRIEATTSNGLANIDYIQITEAVPVGCSSSSFPVILSVTAEQDGNPASNILDGNDADDSRWSADGFPQTVVIDYGENKSIIGTRVSTYLDRAYQFIIELDDNPDFSSPYIIDRSTNTDASQPIRDDFPEVTARFAKITVTGCSVYSGTWVSITEFEIVEGAGGSPVVSITYPLDGASFTEGTNITITADASDSDGTITQVEFFVNESSIGIDNSYPYEIDWTIGGGTFDLTAVATDNELFTTTSPVVNITGGTDPAIMYVESIVTGTVKASGPNYYGTAEVTIINDQSNLVSGASVYGTFSGSFNESVSGVTGADGIVSFQTSSYAKRPTVIFCVDDVTHSTLTYDPNQNQITCSNELKSKSVSISISSDEINIFPNPTSNYVSITYTGDFKNTFVSILDLSGRTLIEDQLLDKYNKLNLSNLESGTYMLKINKGNQLLSIQKIIKY